MGVTTVSRSLSRIPESRKTYRDELAKAGFWSWISTGPSRRDHEGATWHPSIAYIMPRALADRLITVVGQPLEVVPGRVGSLIIECAGADPIEIMNVMQAT